MTTVREVAEKLSKPLHDLADKLQAEIDKFGESREGIIAKRKLEEAMMWAEKHLHHPKVPRRPHDETH